MSSNHIILEAFGKNCDLYADVLECPRDANSAALRRAYYRSALKYHPDKVLQQHSNDAVNATKKANEKFHAITAAYQILCNTDLRKEYDTTGVIPDTSDDDEDDEFNSSNNPWKEYFDRIFGKVTSNDIDLFATKYKCSEEEQRDVLHQYVQQKGNLNKMLQHVMLSEHIDVVRWVQDYINPAIDHQTLTSQYNATMQQTLRQIQVKIEKERNKKAKDKTKRTTKSTAKADVHQQEDDDEDEDDEDYNVEHDDMDEDEDDDEHDDMDDDDDETETDDEEDIPPPRPTTKTKVTTKTTSSTKSPIQKKVQPSVKPKRSVAKSSKATTKKSKNDTTDLIALIQNKHRNAATSSNKTTWSDFGARYGVTIPEDTNDDDDDPIPDHATFQKIQSKLNNHKGKKK